MKSLRRAGITLMVLGIVGILLFTLSSPVQALPSFARKYHTSCMTCHVAPPVLNSFGEAFLNNGYRMPQGEEELIADEQAPLGAPGWKRVWPEGIWPADIPGGNFFAMGLRTGFNWNPSGPVETEFEGIHAFNLFMGGTGGESFSFFGNMAMEAHGGPMEAAFERLFASYNHPSGLFNVTAGNFEPRALPFSMHRTFVHESNYLANTFGSPAGSTFLAQQDGIELWGGVEGPGNKGGLFYSFGLVNGNFALPVGGHGHGEEEEGHEAEEAHGHTFDTNSNKDIYVSASYKIGGLGILGGGAPSTLQQTQNWRDNHLTVGGFLIRGKGPQDRHSRVVPDGTSFIRTGGFFDWWIQDFALKGGYQFNRDEYDHHGLRQYESNILTAEARYVLPFPWVVPYVRFENVNPNFGETFNRTTIAGIIMLRANVILDVQGFLSNVSEHNEVFGFDDKFRVGFRVLF